MPETSSMAGEFAAGWLWKKSGRFTSWKYQYFILRGALLSYYDKYPGEEYAHLFSTIPGYTQSDTSPRGVIRVVHVEIGQKSSIAFKVYGSSGKVLDIRVETSAARAKWVNGLNLACQLGKRKLMNTSTSMDSTDSLDSDDENTVNCAGYLTIPKHGNKYFVLQGNMLSMLANENPWTVPTSRSYVLSVKPLPNNQTLEVQLSHANSGLLLFMILLRRGFHHVPVMPMETLSVWVHGEAGDNVFVDGTVGLGGHSKLLLEGNPKAQLLCIDRDPEILSMAETRLAPFGKRVKFAHGSYVDIAEHLKVSGLNVEKVAGILVDLGVNSHHLDAGDRGFSIYHDGPLDMRFDQSNMELATASDLVNTMSEIDLIKIFKMYGEEPLAKEYAKAIVRRREVEPFERTEQLKLCIEAIADKWKPKQKNKKHQFVHPATRLFQALRIAVNQELDHVERGIPAMMDCLAPQGQLATIAFHSLEDRWIKHYFRDAVNKEDEEFEELWRNKSFEHVKKKPIQATEDEILLNSRSRSAKLRAIRLNLYISVKIVIIFKQVNDVVHASSLIFGLVFMRFGHDHDPVCMQMDQVLAGIAEDVKNFAVDITEVPDFNTMYELYDPCTVMFFYRNKHIMIDLGTGNNNKINWAFNNKGEMIDIIETVYRGARKGRGLVISPKDYSTKYRY
ncbi:S-adenosyl-methyltransferase MraW [Thraustotheca clavata]|uniref:S-adenosyl-methyltransferase MraW n=1 Tax=Thraustotheca clavata TaxID=74557 RepID=A0A1V9ZZH4_9STRA|nr:S-adenosyl-methyltransferase MraW [Thraustotheca clavata]